MYLAGWKIMYTHLKKKKKLSTYHIAQTILKTSSNENRYMHTC